MIERDSGSPPPTDFHVVSSPAQAALLSDPATLRYFEPFLAREVSASAAAEEAGVRLDTLLYRVRRFLAAGLLLVAREQPRRGRPIKIYRSSAEAYFVPFGMTPYVDLAERLKEETSDFIAASYAGMAKVLARHGADGRRLYRKADGTVWRDMADASLRRFRAEGDPGGPADAYMGKVNLREGDALALHAEVKALLDKAVGLHVEGEGTPFLLTLLLVPTQAS